MVDILGQVARYNRDHYLINWAGLYLERLKRFSRRAFISIISKINKEIRVC